MADIRPLTAADAPAAFAVMRASIRDGAGRFYSLAQRQAWMPDLDGARMIPEGFADRLARQTGWIATEDAAQVGFLTVERAGHIDLAYVVPQAMGHGVMAALYDHLMIWAQEMRLAQLTTDASHFFLRFLLRRGWAVTTAETVIRHGVAIERFNMSLNLNVPLAARGQIT